MRMMLLPGVICRGIGVRICRNGVRGRAYVDSMAFQPGWLATADCTGPGVRAWVALDDPAGPQMACNQMLRRHFQKRWLFAPAPLLCVRAARVKAAA